MAKKEFIKITPEGLRFLTIMCYNGYTDGFYNREVFFTDGFGGDLQYLFQALGNMGAFARSKGFDKDVSFVIVSNYIMDNPSSELHINFVTEFEKLLNQNNSPYRKMFFLTEEQLIWKIENRIANTSDEALKRFVSKYKESCKMNSTTLF